MIRRSVGLRLSREKLVCCFPLFSEKRGKSTFPPFSVSNKSFDAIPFAKSFYIIYKDLIGVDCRSGAG